MLAELDFPLFGAPAEMKGGFALHKTMCSVCTDASCTCIGLDARARAHAIDKKPRGKIRARQCSAIVTGFSGTIWVKCSANDSQLTRRFSIVGKETIYEMHDFTMISRFDRASRGN